MTTTSSSFNPSYHTPYPLEDASSGSGGGGFDPTIRSRTSLFLSYRDSRAPRSRFAPSRRKSKSVVFDAYDEQEDQEDESEHAGLLGSGKKKRRLNESGVDGGDLELGLGSKQGGLPPGWVDISDRVEEILRATRGKISALDKLHTKHALPGFADRTAEETEIEKLTTDITRDFRQCHSLIQKIKPDPQVSASGHTFPPQRAGISNQAILAAKNVQRGLAGKVQETSSVFRKKQKVYMDKLQGHAIKNRDLLIASGAISSKGSSGMSEVEEDLLASRSEQLSTQQQLHAPDVNVQERAREIEQIAKSITSLAELFKDLSAMVIEQGTILDSIEFNLEQTAVELEGAVHELTVAKGYQRSAGRRQCIFLLVILIVGAVIVLIFKPKRNSSDFVAHMEPTKPADFVDIPSIALRIARRMGLFTPVQ